jgi:DNA-directed RNA polymerase specialized sigma24 family protein
MDVLPEEGLLVRQARSGDADAFVKLYDAYVKRVYRYIFFRVVNDMAAEDITLHLFRSAWDQFPKYRGYRTSFIAWLYQLSKKLVIEYYSTDIKNNSFNVRTLETMAAFIEELDLGREVTPSDTFEANTRGWLTQYLKHHPIRQKDKPAKALPWRTSWAVTAAITAMLVTGTVHAQAALPGEVFYGWKRTSEQAWRIVSLDPVGTELTIADRRLHELIAVQNDPVQSVNAMHDYMEELNSLKNKRDPETRARIVPVLNTQKQILTSAGLSTVQLNAALVAAASPVLLLTPTPISPTEVVKTDTDGSVKASSPVITAPTAVPTEVEKPTPIPTQVIPTEVPTEIVIPTSVPTEIVVPTYEPTDVPPTEVPPTEVVQPPTDIPPTAVPPPPPTEVPPTEVVAEPTHIPPTDVPPPPPTDAQPAPTDDTGNAPTPASP